MHLETKSGLNAQQIASGTETSSASLHIIIIIII